MGLDVGMLPLDVLPDVGEGIAVELTDPTLVVLLPIVSATTRGGDPRESQTRVLSTDHTAQHLTEGAN